MTKPGKQTHLQADQRAQSAEYIADLTVELSKLARRSHLDLVAYLLDIASLEARNVANREGVVAKSGMETGVAPAIQN
ncbi:hypothetical protein [Enterovirga sp.]|uniref:hypothetical protein n=1 Tax=Enterovirga sp. TaxID=2026350 RepID=UPI002C58DB7F|nr:hypothetical protein [Enterovirga sp.]HMO28499.1 hypothetical protein [Enterovirga sp.]